MLGTQGGSGLGSSAVEAERWPCARFALQTTRARSGTPPGKCSSRPYPPATSARPHAPQLCGSAPNRRKREAADRCAPKNPRSRFDPKTAGPRAGWPRDQLTFDDVARALAAEDVVLFAVSTESRPKIMTPAWVQSHASQTLVTYAAQGWGIPAYTLYLAELTRRSGGQLYFLREAETLADTFRQIALKIRAEYTVGFSPANNGNAPPHPGWHQLRVEVNDHGDPTVVHRSSYFVAATP